MGWLGSCEWGYACIINHVRLFVTLWTVAHRAPLSMGFPRQKYWRGLPFLSPRDLPDPGIEPHLLHWQVDSSHWATGKPGWEPAHLLLNPKRVLALPWLQCQNMVYVTPTVLSLETLIEIHTTEIFFNLLFQRFCHTEIVGGQTGWCSKRRKSQNICAMK